jgi:hypothetical protein
MTVLTGYHGALLYSDTVVTNLSMWEINIQRPSIERTPDFSYAKQFIVGRRSLTGSATLYYDATQSTDLALSNLVKSDGGTLTPFIFSLLRTILPEDNYGYTPHDPRAIEFSGFVTTRSPRVRLNAVTAQQIQFKSSGVIGGSF